jgi:PAS domain S-box-containing protein
MHNETKPMFSSQDLTLQALIDHCPLAIIALDREGKISVWNPAAQRIFGWTASEVLGQTNPIVPAEAHGEYTEDLRRVFSGVPLKGKEVSRSHKDGHRVLVKLWTAPMRSEDGLITGTTAILEDITQQKENERKLLAAEAQQENIQALLQQNEERMRFAFDAATIGYWGWDIVGNTQVWSPIAYKLLGLPESARADFDTLMTAIHPQDRLAFQSAIDVAIQCGEPFRLEYRNIWPDGSVHWRLAAGRVFCGIDNRPTRMTGIVVSIDELKQAQQNLELRAAALQAAANAIVITDREARILWANNAFSELTGYSCEEVVGQNPRILKSGKHDAAFYRELWQTISSGKIWRGELTNRRKDGSLYCEETTITPVRSREGEPTHYIAIKQDISERHRSESALREAETKYRGMFENSVVGIYQCAPDGNCCG